METKQIRKRESKVTWSQSNSLFLKQLFSFLLYTVFQTHPFFITLCFPKLENKQHKLLRLLQFCNKQLSIFFFPNKAARVFVRNIPFQIAFQLRLPYIRISSRYFFKSETLTSLLKANSRITKEAIATKHVISVLEGEILC